MGRPPKKPKTKAGNLRTVFIDEFMIDRNGTEAAKRAGYAPRSAAVTACRLLKDPKIMSEIDRRTTAQSKRLNITSDQVLQNIVDIGDRCMQRWPMMRGQGKERKQVKEYVTTEDGEEVLADVFEFDSQGALKAQELLGKHLKLFTDKTEVEHTGGVTLHLPGQFESAEQWEAADEE